MLAVNADLCFGETSIEVSDDVPEIPEGFCARVSFPVLALLDTPTSDGRVIASAGFSHRQLPLPIMLKDMFTATGAHDRARLCGSLRHIEVNDKVVSGWGYLLDTQSGRDAEMYLRTGAIRGVSADLADATMEPIGGTVGDGIRLSISKSRLSAATLVPIPAFAEAHGKIDTPPLVAAAALVSGITRPREWFADPKLEKPTGVTVTPEGRVFGHVALLGQCHVGYPGCRTAPPDDDFAEFYGGGGVECDNGEFVRTGTIFIGGPHADGQMSGDEAMRFYSDTSYAWADVVVGYDKFGVWCAGAMRPEVSDALAYHAKASALSGHWSPAKNGPRKGKLTLRAILSCNSPGFPVAQSESLVAAGPPPNSSLRQGGAVSEESPNEATVATQTESSTFAPVQVKPYYRNGKLVRGYRRSGGVGVPDRLDRSRSSEARTADSADRAPSQQAQRPPRSSAQMRNESVSRRSTRTADSNDRAPETQQDRYRRMSERTSRDRRAAQAKLRAKTYADEIVKKAVAKEIARQEAVGAKDAEAILAVEKGAKIVADQIAGERLKRELDRIKNATKKTPPKKAAAKKAPAQKKRSGIAGFIRDLVERLPFEETAI